MADDLTAELDRIAERHQIVAAAELNPSAFGGNPYAALVQLADEDVPRLLAALRAAIGFHVEAVIEDLGYSFHYCVTCSGHPKWPCPEVAAITRALNGEKE